MINDYLAKSNQNLVHYLSCQVVSHTACILISAQAVCLKAFISGPMASGLMGLASKVQALVLRP